MKLGIFDIGSNAIKFRMWKIKAGKAPRPEMNEREAVRLGESVFLDGRLSGAVIAQAVAAIAKLAEKARKDGADVLRAVATSAMRDAANAKDMAAELVRATGIALEILGEAEETRLVARGALSLHPEATGDYLIFDIGGGSLEIIQGRIAGADEGARDAATFASASLPLGAVRMTEMFFPSLPPSPAEIAKAEAHMRALIEAAFPAGRQKNPNAPPLTLGGGGTIHALGAALEGTAHGRHHDDAITADGLEALIGAFAALDAADIASKFAMDPRRAEIILAGALAVREVLRHFDLPGLLPSMTSLADGILAEWLAAHGE